MPFADAIEAWLATCETGSAGRKFAAYSYLKPMDSRLVAFVAAKQILDEISKGCTLTHAIMGVSASVEDEARFTYFKKTNPKVFERAQRKFSVLSSTEHKRTVTILIMNREGIAWDTWNHTTRASVGALLVDLFCQTTGLTAIAEIRTGKWTKKFLQPTDSASEWIRGFNEYAELLEPVFLPTVEIPQDWTRPDMGGYGSSQLPSMALVKRSGGAYVKRLAQRDLTEVYNSVNALQRTAWKVNKPVLEVMRNYWERSHALSSLPGREDMELPQKPDDIASNEAARKEWRTKAARVHRTNVALRSLRIHAAKLFFVADKFKEQPAFHFPYQLDFRGRVYAVPSYLSPQGNDASRALLTFANGEPMKDATDAEWLKIYGANLFGVDKVTFEDRKAWVDANAKDIIASAEDPLNHHWWESASEPWQFLAWCFEWNGWVKQGPGFVTHLPVCVDGTNNGLQILSLLTRDEIAAEATNVLPGQQPQDIYREVADNALKLMSIEADPKNAEIARYWLAFGINRKTTKRPVMVLPYGGKFQSCRAYIQDWYEETAREKKLELPDSKTVFLRCHYLAKIVWASISFCVGRPREAMTWLQEVASIVTASGQPIRWVTPVGLEVEQAYFDVKKFTVQATLGDKSRVTVNLAKDSNKLSRSQQRNGIAPNFVHSLDAAALMRTVNHCLKAGVASFCMIHDSYGALSTRMHEVSAYLRVSFHELFGPDLLNDFRTQLLAQVPAGTELPEVPEKGSLNPSLVLQSEFFFA
jgi:DNA-directed RNA polymerase